MMFRFGLIFLGCMATSAWAIDRWSFNQRIAISADAKTGIFHHLDGAGRKHIAVSQQLVAVAWEDNRSGDPQVYVAFKTLADKSFSKAVQVSTGQEAYEPAITSLDRGRFVVAWEQDGSIYAELVQQSLQNAPIKLSQHGASHVSLASFNNRVFAVWREQQDRFWSLQVAELDPGNDQLKRISLVRVEAQKLSKPVLYPTITASTSGLSVAWEDRRSGHTRLLFSHRPIDSKSFDSIDNLNEFFSNRNEYDKGNGVTRVSMHTFAEDEVIAAWMDKRRGGAGYGIFAALGDSGGEAFGPNERVHSQNGDAQPHYNPATAGNSEGDFVIIWDDFRLGDSDIWLSSYNEDEEWSEDFSPPPASGPGEQSHPSAVLDTEGNIHLVWIERGDPLSPTGLWYSFGTLKLKN